MIIINLIGNVLHYYNYVHAIKYTIDINREIDKN